MFPFNLAVRFSKVGQVIAIYSCKFNYASSKNEPFSNIYSVFKVVANYDLQTLNLEIGHIRPASMTADPESSFLSHAPVYETWILIITIVICLPIINSDIALDLRVLLVLVLVVYFLRTSFSGLTVCQTLEKT